ncbi:cation:proton antiporter [Streptomyces sp. ET3-23]|uniref:cation:proton antiporter domain-containing protein n=1 Tax=Streptomyces sp. ET3-23 TaxID=2885643 RepID=UPI001D0FC129|nr:cation:proton antiporter [Streptomyces sp. ET3-23]MCC2277836.1 cation:proton antiporter [Streptomyces sp. ET3-23]
MNALPPSRTAPEPVRTGGAQRPGRVPRLGLVLLLGAGPVVLAGLLLRHGAQWPAHPGAARGGGRGGGAAKAPEPWRLLLALAVVVAAARAVGGVFARFLRQPRVVGEMVSGIVLGPSVLGAVAPHVHRTLFPAGLLPCIDAFAQIGLALFMFLVGLEFAGESRAARGPREISGVPGSGGGSGGTGGRAGTMIGLCGTALPYSLGVALACALYGTRAPDGVGFLPFALFLGVAMSVTAFPVLASILMERGMMHTRAGRLAVLAAAGADLLCWLLLAVAVALLRNASLAGVARTLALTTAFCAAMVLLVRPLLRTMLLRPARWLPDGALLALVLVGVLLSGVATDRIGVHLIFGAFLFGALCPADAPGLRAVQGRMQEFTTSVLLPPFFASVGLKTELGLLGGDSALWLWFAAALAVAVAGKLAGSGLAAALTGVGGRDALRVGVLMNCRGLTELVILGIGLELGVLTPSLFTVLVLVALTATAMTAPLLDLLDRGETARNRTLLSDHH